ncbi:class I SAM-dependent methyltransferase [Paenibacillus rigui]|uniref:SAM-dependent methyltransferase n=1 Tax=Paenibacillus rigui TaxID=554312 RepID=A0A229UG26_9BACL|nr:class I SAM-dependent methyltransferase [Paenibacillus rigui]OXM82335.1 SAM-dependent methyltransferase [Paenibacillus rigui]
MRPAGHNQNNVDRFSGYAGGYDQNRPEAPKFVVELLTQYLGRRPALVVDVGSGTGLSSFIWKAAADRVIGVEPNEDMRSKAEEKRSRMDGAGHISFVPGYSNGLKIESGAADVITCSQSFHWMEPVSTLKEASRVLRDGGIFAAYDCDWPPMAGWEVEEAYNELIRQADDIIAQHVEPGDRAVKRNKEEHLRTLQESGVFRFTKEAVFHNKERCDAARYVGLALSQGGVQTVQKLGSTALKEAIERLSSRAEAYFNGQTRDVVFGYRMRLGLK